MGMRKDTSSVVFYSEVAQQSVGMEKKKKKKKKKGS